ncbi:hypothetical protein E3N88_05569 [Mikania micrantha]|uniref:DUF630 domain-containing protein n=1 Tax=Mikania micrantha TaxID=192012 RepID=A0A5N6PLA8_9ASTR|nr:hypothetical protein E3N88_05569 [Mikania micrantha]
MGCTQSKIENEEIVIRCKDRKTMMKEAVSARNAFAAAHFSYAAALKNTGAAISDYAQGEVEFSDHRHSSSVDAVSSKTILPPAPPQPPYDTLFPPPPPPLQRASTMPELSTSEPELNSHPDPIMEEVDEDDEIDDRSLKRRSSSRKSGGGGASRKEDIPPPSPPEPTPPRPTMNTLNRATPPPPPPYGMSSWDYFFPAMEHVPGSSLDEIDNASSTLEQEDLVKIQRKVLENEKKHSPVNHNMNGGEEGGGDNEVDDVPPEVVEETPPPKAVKKVKIPVAVPAEVRRSSGKGGGLNLNLVQIFTELDDCFLKASESANEVSKMLEANRLHYHSNFADNRGM